MQISDLSYPAEPLLKLPEDVEPKLALLLQQYQKVFDKPSGLPPTRNQDHSIPLLKDSGLVKVNPYRYPHS